MKSTLLLLALTILYCANATAKSDTTAGPRVLIVDAHPDDETAYAATVYKIVHDLHGMVDLIVVTNGEGGYKYSTLAEDYYHLKLTDEKVGRAELPKIRKKELRRAGDVIGLRHIYFLDQKDNRYMLNAHEVLDSTIWDTAMVERQIKSIMKNNRYDFLFTLLPTDSTHGHHKAATIMALRALTQLPIRSRPIALAGGFYDRKDPSRNQPFHMLAGYPLTAVSPDTPSFYFDRTQSFGYRHVLNYKMIVNWEIAEHKSQGTMQQAMNMGDSEAFWYYDINAIGGREKAESLFASLAINRYPELHYPGEIR